MSSKPEEKKVSTDRDLLRHSIATLAYRGGKAIRGAPEGFSDFRASEKTRTPGQILAHLSDLIDWALSMAKGKQECMTRRRGRGMRTPSGSLRRCSRLTITSHRIRRSMLPLTDCFKVRWQTR